MKAGVVTFPGSNCDDDTVFALRSLGEFEAEALWHKTSTSLADFDLIVLPGGFSYGDYLRTGAIASISPIMDRIKEFASQGGWVLGICNGFQILCESGLLPGALVRNESQKFICKNIEIKTTSKSPWTHQIPQGSTLTLPIAHGEGRYLVDAENLDSMKRNDQIAFRYQDNINGSMDQIAGVTNKEKNVLGLMPHPERATDLKSQDGKKIWKSLLQWKVGS